jgi:hypothetical protein
MWSSKTSTLDSNNNTETVTTETGYDFSSISGNSEQTDTDFDFDKMLKEFEDSKKSFEQYASVADSASNTGQYKESTPEMSGSSAPNTGNNDTKGDNNSFLNDVFDSNNTVKTIN